MNNVLKNVLLWVAIGVILMLVFQNLNTSSSTPAQAMDFSTFVSSIKQGQVADVTINGNHVEGSLNSGQHFSVYTPANDTQVVPQLLAAGVKISVKPPEGQSLLLSILISWFPMLLLIGVWIFFMRQMGGGGAGGRGAMTFGRSKARMLTEENNKVTFADVAGIEEAKDELAEIVEFLRDPQKFQRLGGRIPKGVLLMGSPGSGKTLLARAIAGEARVPFFSI
ncbi:AAA family ATPase, partial [Acidithiobacillus ferrooxidans]|nr:AAA family ATPase [Acidithiobacillus ferrooxidans]